MDAGGLLVANEPWWLGKHQGIDKHEGQNEKEHISGNISFIKNPDFLDRLKSVWRKVWRPAAGSGQQNQAAEKAQISPAWVRGGLKDGGCLGNICFIQQQEQKHIKIWACFTACMDDSYTCSHIYTYSFRVHLLQVVQINGLFSSHWGQV